MIQRARSAIGDVVQRAVALRGGLYVDLNHDYRKSVLVAGSGRSGTTWLAEIINSRKSFRDIFEPFHPIKVKICRHFGNRQYLRPMDDNLAYLDPARTIMSGRIRNIWTDAYNRRVICDRRLIKEIRVNLILKWFRHHFPEMPIVYILRHPCAVVNSRLQKQWSAQPEELLAQAALVDDHLHSFASIIKGVKSPFERHFVLWCIENYVPLRQLRGGDALVVFYEDLYTQPEREVARLSNYLGMDRSEIAIGRVGKPSSQTRKRESAIVAGQDVIRSWGRHVSEEQVEFASSMLDLFGLSQVYNARTPTPLVNADQVLPT
jgi:hypothetical protein